MSSKEPAMESTNHIWVVDRIENQIASVEVDGGKMRDVPVWVLPKGAREGDVFRVRREQRIDRSVLMIVVDDEERRRRLEQSQRQMEGRHGNDPGGDIVL